MEAKGRKRENLAAFIRSLGYDLEIERHGRLTTYKLSNSRVSFSFETYRNLDYKVNVFISFFGEFHLPHEKPYQVEDTKLSNLIRNSIGYVNTARLKRIIKLNAIQQ